LGLENEVESLSGGGKLYTCGEKKLGNNRQKRDKKKKQGNLPRKGENRSGREKNKKKGETDLRTKSKASYTVEFQKREGAGSIKKPRLKRQREFEKWGPMEKKRIKEGRVGPKCKRR